MMHIDGRHSIRRGRREPDLTEQAKLAHPKCLKAGAARPRLRKRRCINPQFTPHRHKMSKELYIGLAGSWNLPAVVATSAEQSELGHHKIVIYTTWRRRRRVPSLYVGHSFERHIADHPRFVRYTLRASESESRHTWARPSFFSHPLDAVGGRAGGDRALWRRRTRDGAGQEEESTSGRLALRAVERAALMRPGGRVQ